MKSNIVTVEGPVINTTVIIDESRDIDQNLKDDDASEIVTTSGWVSRKMVDLILCIDNLAERSEVGICTRLRNINHQLHQMLRKSYIRLGCKLVTEIFNAHDLLKSRLARCSNPSTRLLIKEYQNCITAIALECLENA